MSDIITLIIGGILFFVGIMFLLLIGAVIYQYFKNKVGKEHEPKPPTPKETWTNWKKVGRSILVIGLWALANFLGWYGLFPEFWEGWYGIGEKFFWTCHAAIVSIFLVGIWLRDEENKNKRVVNRIIYALTALLFISIGVKLNTIADENGWWPEEVVDSGAREKKGNKASRASVKKSVTEKFTVPVEGIWKTFKATDFEFLIRNDSGCVLIYAPNMEYPIENCYEKHRNLPNGTYRSGEYFFIPSVPGSPAFVLAKMD